jgi:HEAT repeat protein
MIIFDEYETRRMPLRQRLDKVTQILRNERDESIRWDAVWLAGEITEAVEKENPMLSEIADLMAWVLRNDDNGIVKHEAAFQIGVRNMRTKIPDLLYSAMNDKSEIARHESIEALGLMRAHEATEKLIEMATSSSDAVRETAIFVLKRLARLKNKGEYKVENIL